MSLARWLALRAHQVMLPSFRGSTGFGRRFERRVTLLPGLAYQGQRHVHTGQNDQRMSLEQAELMRDARQVRR